MDAQVIVVGAGAAGPVVARRLLDAGASVLLVEAGGPDANPQIHDPGLTFGLKGGAEDWAHRTVAQEHLGGRVIDWPRGFVLGGSTAVNGMIYVRGWAGDYDHWAYLGNHGWGYADVLPLFRRSEDVDEGDPAFHGTGGPFRVTTRYAADPIHHAIVEAAQAAGLPRNPDYNGATLDGVTLNQFSIRDGRRESSATAFLAPVADRPALTVLTGARVLRLVFEGTRCRGVEVARNGRVEVLHADHEVVLCAGALESPRILTLSGLAGARELRRLGIDVRVDLPEVGRNLQDHLLAPVIFTTDRPTGPLGAGLPPMQSQLWWRSRPGLVSPDLQPLAFGVPLYDGGYLVGPEDGFTLSAGIVRPASRGTIRLRSSDPADVLEIDPRYLSAEVDVRALVAAIELCRDIGAQAPLAEAWGAKEVHPGPGHDDVEAYARRTVASYWHPVGTCRMGVDEHAVVDPELRVRGVEGLRIADASIMPTIVSGNTAAPTMMIGEKAADLVAASLGLSVDAVPA
jgi:choline dehydrogenase